MTKDHIKNSSVETFRAVVRMTRIIQGKSQEAFRYLAG